MDITKNDNSINNFLYKILFYLLINLILINSPLIANHPDLISTNSEKYELYLSKMSNNPVKFLKENWQIFTDDNLDFQTVNIPFLLSEKTKKVLFKNTFSIPDSLMNHDLKIWFLGVYGITQIMVNKVLIKERVNSISSFFIDIPREILQISDKNLIEIIIKIPENTNEGLPSFVQLFNQKKYLGIYREIFLEWVPSIHFTDIHYSFQNDVLKFFYSLSAEQMQPLITSSNNTVQIEELILSPEGMNIFKRIYNVDQKSQKSAINRITSISNPKLWSPENPNLYKLVLSYRSSTGKTSRVIKDIGLRKIEVKNGNLLVNSNNYSVRGINYREKYINLVSADSDKRKINFYTQILEDFIEIKNMGFNTIKFPGSAPHPYCLHVADSLGLFLFIENGIWRLPEKYFTLDNFLSNIKNITNNILDISNLHPSILAVGLGTEIPIHIPEVQKYALILNEYVHQNSDILTYISPIDYKKIPQNKITDFYVINKYDQSIFPFLVRVNNESDLNITTPVILGNVGFAVQPIIKNEQEIDMENRQYSQIQDFFMIYRTKIFIDGFFIESYQDWLSNGDANIAINIKPGFEIYPYGLAKWNGDKRFLFKKIADLLNNRFMEPFDYNKKNKQTNFFSLTIFFAAIVFFLIYRSNHRFRENVSRAITHPYGFFVDLRDRRIISTLNSSIIGLFSTLLVANFGASYIYYFKENLWIEEITKTILGPSNLYKAYLYIADSPLRIIIVFWMILFLSQIIIAMLLKIINFLFEEKIRLRQFLAICNWSGTPLLFFLPVSLLSYHLFQYGYLHSILFISLVIFIIWFNFRIANGIRILLILKPYKIFLLMLLTYTGLIITLAFVLNLNFEIMDYLSLLLEADNLF